MDLLQQRNAESAEYDDLLSDILGLLRGTYRSSPTGSIPIRYPGPAPMSSPGCSGSSAGESAEAAGRLGIRFAASYHISPATALAAAEAYRGLCPRGALAAPMSPSRPMSWWPRMTRAPGSWPPATRSGSEHPARRGRDPFPRPR